MVKISAIQTYSIDVNPNIDAFAKNFILYNNDNWFKLRLQKIYANSHSIKTFDKGLVNVIVKATAYLTIIPGFGNESDELVNGKVSFTLDLSKVKISDLKGTFEAEANHNAKIDLDLNFNLKLSQRDKNFFTTEIARIIAQVVFKVNIEQTASEIEFIEK